MSSTKSGSEETADSPTTHRMDDTGVRSAAADFAARGDLALHDVVAATPATLLGIPFIVGLVVSLVFPLPLLPVPLAQIVGLGLVVLGILLNSWAVRTLAGAGTSPDAFRPPPVLVTAGPFRFTRNPMYLGFVLIYAGAGLVANSLWIVLLLPVVVVGLTWGIIVRDERLLEKRFGDAYRGYRSRVRRWL